MTVVCSYNVESKMPGGRAKSEIQIHSSYQRTSPPPSTNHLCNKLNTSLYVIIEQPINLSLNHNLDMSRGGKKGSTSHKSISNRDKSLRIRILNGLELLGHLQRCLQGIQDIDDSSCTLYTQDYSESNRRMLVLGVASPHLYRRMQKVSLHQIKTLAKSCGHLIMFSVSWQNDSYKNETH